MSFWLGGGRLGDPPTMSTADGPLCWGASLPPSLRVHSILDGNTLPPTEQDSKGCGWGDLFLSVDPGKLTVM